MQTITVSATKARQDFFNIFNKVFAGTEVLVKKDGKQTIRMSPMVISDGFITKRKKLLKSLAQTHGAVKDFKIEDNPLRGKKSIQWLGQWDKGMNQ
jgi:hypothetical protein